MQLLVHHNEIAVFVARIFLGLLFFFQGYDAVFRIKVGGVIETIKQPLMNKGVPKFFIRAGAYFTSYAELICGTFLLIGFVKYYSLYFLGIDLLFAAFAFGIIKPMWDMQFVFPRLVLLIFLLIVPTEWDVLSIDYNWSFIKFIKSF